MKRLFLIASLLFSFSIHSFAQGCDVSPADCPDASSIEDSQDSVLRIGNGLLPQEIRMQNSMRTLAIRMMEKAAKALHWQMVELDEFSNLNPFQGAGTLYNLRSPREFGIAFQFIVNKDSLQAWRNWVKDFNDRYMNFGKAAFQQDNDIQNSPQYRRYYDSVQHYTKLFTDYIAVHPKVRADEDPKAKYLIKQQDNFINKMNNLRQNGGNSSGESLDDLDKENDRRTLQFKGETLVQVFFEFNQSVGLINTSSNINTKDIPVQGTKVAKEVHLADPELNSLPWHFESWNNMKVLLLGNWNSKPSDQNYSASYGLNGQGDEHTPKKIKSDKVQTIAIHILGNDQNTNKIMPFINTSELNKVIVRN